MQLILWGTKWDASDPEVEEIADDWVEYTFCTAWSPPIAFLIRASTSYPSLQFRLRYEEPGDDICGRIHVVNGKVESWQELAEVMEDKEKAKRILLEGHVRQLGCSEETWPRFGGRDAVRDFVTQRDGNVAQAL